MLPYQNLYLCAPKQELEQTLERGCASKVRKNALCSQNVGIWLHTYTFCTVSLGRGSVAVYSELEQNKFSVPKQSTAPLKFTLLSLTCACKAAPRYCR